MSEGNVLPLSELRRLLDAGETSSTQLTDACLARIDAAVDQGARVFTRVYRAEAQVSARAQDELLGAGLRLSPLAGIPLSIKDLFDVAGEETLSASPVPSPDGAAERDALAIARLRAAGAVIVGRTNMTAYAFSGVGRNLHHGTPGNPYDQTRIPGGSSSGAAVSVAEGMAAAAIGSDTAGSVRIPAALCGLVGFKPTQRRVPLDGVRPLSWSLDSVGPLAASVDCCHLLDAIMAGQPLRPLAPVSLDGLRLGVPNQVVLEDLDPQVAEAFEQALAELSRHGARIISLDFPEITDMFALGGIARIIGAEAYTILRGQMDQICAATESVVGARLAAGADISAADYLETMRGRDRLIDSAARTLAAVDTIVMPTVPLLAPTLASLEDDAEFLRVNRLLIRNTSIANFLNLCSITLPVIKPGNLPVGIMLTAAGGHDQRLLAIGKAVEGVLPAR